MDRDLQITEAFEHSFMQRIDNGKTREASCQVKLLTRRDKINMNQIVVMPERFFGILSLCIFEVLSIYAAQSLFQ